MASGSGSGSGPVPPKYARVRPSTDGNPLITRRRPPRPASTPRASLTSTDLLSIKASQWAASSVSAIAAQKEREVNTINDTDWIPYKLTTTKASILKSLRHHVIRLHPKRYKEVPDPNNPAETISVPRKVDLLDPAEFARPIRLHRRNPCAPLGGVKETEAARLLAVHQMPVYDKEKEAWETERAQKAASKAEVASKIAPYGVDGIKKNRFAKKTEQVFHRDQSNAQMRYEESQPWFIEDFDNSNTWQGQREQNLSGGKFVALVYGKDSKSFNMIPIEKWYKFREVNKFKMTPEEAVERKRQLDRKVRPWVKVEKPVEVDEPLTAEEARLYQKYSRLVVKNVVTSKGSEEAKATAELEGMDYDQEFDNDDAGQLYGVDGDDDEEEQKEIEKRIKKEQLTANNGLRAGRVYEEDSAAKIEVAAAARTHGKKTRQFLRKREGNNNYDSDSDSNPYASSQEDDEDVIAAHAEAVKTEVVARLKADDDRKAAEAVLESKKAADVAERKAKASQKRRETANKKKAEKALEAGEPSHAVSARLAVLEKKVKSMPPAPHATPAGKTMEGKPLGSNKRTSRYITGFDSGSDSNPVEKKPRKNAKVSNNTVKPGVPRDITPMSPSAAKKATHKRKPEILPGELQGNKKQRVDHPSHAPSPAVARRANTAPNSGPITDEELKAVLRSHPDGVTMKGITEAFKGRMTKSSEDIKAMVASMKRVGKVGPVKGKYVLKDALA